jgi:hypothetical protein
MPEDKDPKGGESTGTEGKTDTGVEDKGSGVDERAAKTVEYEEKAYAKGWRKEEEYQGDKEDWIGAEEFVKREPLFKRIKSQGKSLKEMKETLEAMSNHFKSQVESQVNTRIAELNVKKEKAIVLGEVETVKKIDAAIDQVKETVPVQNENTPPEVMEFVKNNSWFEKNEEMKDFAVAHNSTLLNKYPLEEALKRTRLAVERAFPDYFGKKPTVVDDSKEHVSTVEAGGTKTKSKTGYTMARLNPEQKIVYEQLVKRAGNLTHEEYFKSLDEAGELQ